MITEDETSLALQSGDATKVMERERVGRVTEKFQEDLKTKVRKGGFANPVP